MNYQRLAWLVAGLLALGSYYMLKSLDDSQALELALSKAAYLDDACESKGYGRVVGDLPIAAQGYLVSSELGSVSDPLFYTHPFTSQGMEYVEYRTSAYERAVARFSNDNNADLPAQEVAEAPLFIRVSLAKTGDPSCSQFELERSKAKEIPPEFCLSLQALDSEDSLLSRYVLRQYKRTVADGPVPFTWRVVDVLDRETQEVVASNHQYLLCLTERVVTAGRGLGACIGHSPQTPKEFGCPRSSRVARTSAAKIRYASFKGKNELQERKPVDGQQ